MHSHWACSAALDQAVSITAMTQRVRPLCSHRLRGSTQDKQQQIYIKSDWCHQRFCALLTVSGHGVLWGPVEVWWLENSCKPLTKGCAIFVDEVVTSHGPIEADKENIRQEPYSLPQGFMWDTLDLSNADVVSAVFVQNTPMKLIRLIKTEWFIVTLFCSWRNCTRC